MKTIPVGIGGLTCSACVRRVERALSETSGVKHVAVHLASETAYITLDPELIRLVDLETVIRNAGYEPKAVVHDLSGASKTETGKHQILNLVRIITGLVTGSILMIVMFKDDWHTPIGSWFVFLLSTPVFIFISQPIFRNALQSLKHRILDMDVMYAMGMGASYGASVLGTFNIFLDHQFMFYESAVLLAAFLMLGRHMESLARRRTNAAVRKLLALTPATAHLILPDGSQSTVPVEAVVRGDRVLVKSGETIPIDGKIIEGGGHVDESSFSGEFVPVYRKIEETVLGGSILTDGMLIVGVTHTGPDTAVNRIAQSIQQAQSTKPAIQNLADRLVGYFIPVILTIAVVTFVIWFWVLDAGAVFAFTTFISVLVIACPCALGLATPTAVTVGIGRGAQLGILIRDAQAIQVSDRITHVLFDKTGTITRGLPQITDIITHLIDERSLLAYMAALEKFSSHPLSRAIVEKAAELEAQSLTASSFESIAGSGIKGYVGPHPAAVGNPDIFRDGFGTLPSELIESAEKLRLEGKTVVFCMIKGLGSGLTALADTMKPHVHETLRRLESMNLKTGIISGDHRLTTEAIARQAGMSLFFPETTPAGKKDIIINLIDKGHSILFVGDGINDAPALASSHIGIACGSASDIARETGNVILIRDDIRLVAETIGLCRSILRRIRWNLMWAFFYNSLLIPVAAGLLYPFIHVLIRPQWAGLAMAFSSISVVISSLSLNRYNHRSTDDLSEHDIHYDGK